MDIQASYFGGKGQIFRHHINLIPPHRVFVSAYAGACAVARFKRPAETNVLIDRDVDVIRGWADYLVGNSGVYRHLSSELAMGAAIAGNGGDGQHLQLWRGWPAAAVIAMTDGASWHLYVEDCLDLLGLGVGDDWFVYADPPYLFETRSSQRPQYKFEYDKFDHIKLLNVLVGLDCRAMVCGYGSLLYDTALVDWRFDVFDARTRMGRWVKEYVWMNYKRPLRLHDYDWLGENYRERERIKRKRGRWAEKLAKMGELERRAILAAIDEVVGIEYR